ncbi:MAG: hypothetical protein H0V91_11410, partial [Flavisolibacter sp.]|nr:hypothetical protein [Flavisolibacter sp.]
MLPALRVFFFVISFPMYSAISQNSAANTPVKGCKPPINRQIFHDYIDREQKSALKADGKGEMLFQGAPDDERNYLITNTLVDRVDALQCKIEADTISSSQKKVAYLRGVEKMLRNFTTSYRSRSFNPSNVPAMIEAYEKAMIMDISGESIESIIAKANYDIGNSIIVSGAFDMNTGFKTAKEILIRKYTAAHPERTFLVLRDNDDLPFRDSLILVAAYKHPRLLYDYAAANNKLGIAIRKIDDSLVQAVVKMARSNSGQLYFPFLDNILKGNQTVEEIDKVKGDDVKYYKLLVKTRIDYVSRSLNKEKVYEMDALNYMLGKRAKDVFIKTINALHNDPDPVRFRILNQLTAQELYYLAVNGESDIYTSSYTRGVYPMLMQRIGNRGDSLLVSVNFDRFKKFIKMAAGFNTLSNFLNSFPNQDQAESLMTAFVNGIERSPNLEDGVDVADSYASISETMKPMATKMLENVKANLDRTTAQNNRRGMVMYNLLYKLFLSADTTLQINLSQEFGIPPVYNIAYQDLLAEQKAVMQVFFYGDEDGRSAY